MKIKLGWIVSVGALAILTILDYNKENISPLLWTVCLLIMFTSPFFIDDINLFVKGEKDENG